jgi:pyrimidine deaminase RibD-like protein
MVTLGCSSSVPTDTTYPAAKVMLTRCSKRAPTAGLIGTTVGRPASKTAFVAAVSDLDSYFMDLALKEGRKALPACLPNPPVGCVLVKDGEVIATGYTNPPGKHHAEAMALAQVRGALLGVTAYVTLEPCSFHGRTPSCAKTLAARGIDRVVVAILDPDPRNAGAGAEMLRVAGVKVCVGTLEVLAREDLGPYLKEGFGRGEAQRQYAGPGLAVRGTSSPARAWRPAVARLARQLGAANTMSAVQPCEVPLNSLLRSYKDGAGYADCYVVEVPGSVTQEAFIEAFYTSPLFKVERTILKYLVSRPASDSEAKQLAEGRATKFSAWRIEGQSPSELLLADFTGRTRSWLMAVPVTGSVGAISTRLYFGSAVVPHKSRPAQTPSMGWPFHALLGFHRLYSRLLLAAASRRVGSA